MHSYSFVNFLFFYILISQNVQKLNHQNVNVCIFSTFWKKSIVTPSSDKNIFFVCNAKILFVCFRVSTTTEKLIIIHYSIYLKQAANCPYCHSYFIGNYRLSIVPMVWSKKSVFRLSDQSNLHFKRSLLMDPRQGTLGCQLTQKGLL